ncbi:MAG: Re/Si-specific NAD(P)(+) transhydrogenase subunit alpha [Balneolaceae bacterium]|nr:MAG: Re/Si-specific NAD(P)(+) transhydrogenase subunit alpha [Balneolaceae bacterium]
MLTAAVCRETLDNETRVALSPEGVRKLTSLGYEVRVEKNAGDASSYTDEHYISEGAKIISDRDALLSDCDLLLAVRAPRNEDILKLKLGTVLISFIWPLQHPEYVELLRKAGITALAMDAIPRISRAQSMDALSSMGNISGYKAALLGAFYLDKYMPMMMTAAGTIPPAKALILGAGVAGLQAIATARRLGAVVEAFDIRPAVKEQVESLGASFVDVPLEEENTESKGGYAKELSDRNKEKQKEIIHQHVAKSDLVITTAQIPGKKAPLLITKEMVEEMKPGSVLVDIAAEQGGNCEVTRPGEKYSYNGVIVIGPVNLPGTLASHASKLYSKNILALMDLLIREKKPLFDFNDDIILNTTITHNGEIISPFVKENQ